MGGGGESAAERRVILQIGAVSMEDDITAGFFIFFFYGWNHQMCGATKPFCSPFTSFDQDNLFEHFFSYKNFMISMVGNIKCISMYNIPFNSFSFAFRGQDNLYCHLFLLTNLL
jgi:hypothetical protein